MAAESRELFWDDVKRTMTTPQARADLTAEAELFAEAMTDGLEDL